MHRNLSNRWWAITLVCVLGLAFLAAVPAPGLAGAVTKPVSGGDPGAVPLPDPTASGDPDSPQNSGSPSVVSAVGRNTMMRSTQQVSTAPGETWTQNVWVIQIRFALQMVRVFYLHD